MYLITILFKQGKSKSLNKKNDYILLIAYSIKKKCSGSFTLLVHCMASLLTLNKELHLHIHYKHQQLKKKKKKKQVVASLVHLIIAPQSIRLRHQQIGRLNNQSQSKNTVQHIQSRPAFHKRSVNI